MSNKQITFYMDSSISDVFDRLYPRLRSRFLKLCIEKSIQDKQFFDSVYFGDVFGDNHILFENISNQSDNIN